MQVNSPGADFGDQSPVQKEKNIKCRGVFTFKQPCILKELSFPGLKGLQGHQTEDSTKKRAARAKTGCCVY